MASNAQLAKLPCHCVTTFTISLLAFVRQDSFGLWESLFLVCTRICAPQIPLYNPNRPSRNQAQNSLLLITVSVNCDYCHAYFVGVSSRCSEVQPTAIVSISPGYNSSLLASPSVQPFYSKARLRDNHSHRSASDQKESQTLFRC